MAKLSQLSRGMMTSISEKLVSFYAKVSWEYEKFAKVLRGFNWEGRCPQRPSAA